MPSPYFDASVLPNPTNEYVAWVDLMGVQSAMSRSLNIAANFVFKLHVAALQAPHPAGISLYPVMDGLYVASSNQLLMFEFLRSVFVDVAQSFVEAEQHWYRFVIRGALAFGPVVHGAAVPPAASHALKTAVGGPYKNAILLGMPMVQAHLFEKNAPPFGLFVHESARAFAPEGATPLHHVWWKWGNPTNEKTWKAVPSTLTAYFQWCCDNADFILYNRERIKVHDELARQYFAT
jgi:hypothetical protein